MNKRGQLIVYSGPSGVGKGTLLHPLVEPGGEYALSVSATTRAPRPGETDGIEYHFVAREEFERMIREGEMLEHASYNGNYYGTPRRFVEKQLSRGVSVVLEIEVQGAMKVKKSFPGALFVFVLPPSYEELEKRLTGRGTESKEQIMGRLHAAREEIAFAKEYDFVVVNDDLDEARTRLAGVFRAGRQLTRLNNELIEEVLRLC